MLSSEYTNATLVKQFPYLTTLKASLDNAVARPLSPYYPAITTAIENNTYAALTKAANGQNPDVTGTLSADLRRHQGGRLHELSPRDRPTENRAGPVHPTGCTGPAPLLP